jgi:hypothetical protein
VLPHCVFPLGQEHFPPAHTIPGPHAFQQLPQFCGSVSNSTQALPHWLWPAAHW